MNPGARQLLACSALLLGTATLPAQAETLSASSVAGGSSASSAGSSASERSSDKSSDSSSRKNQVAEGPYRIVEVAAVAERPGLVRLRLQALADGGADGQWLLYLPQATFEQSRLAAGQTVAARARPYGVEFAHADSGKAFFLVLDDDWYRELASNPVLL